MSRILLKRLLILATVLLAYAGQARAESSDVPSSDTPAPSLDFDLLAPPATEVPQQSPALQPPTAVESLESTEDVARMRLRRTFLDWHQGIGLGLVALNTGAVVTGQLNYNDRYGGDDSARYRLPHQIFSYGTAGVGTVVAGLALFAPERTSTVGPRRGDTQLIHKAALWTAFGTWAAQVALGLYITSKPGALDQQTVATGHLALGYASLGATLVGLYPIVF